MSSHLFIALVVVAMFDRVVVTVHFSWGGGVGQDLNIIHHFISAIPNSFVVLLYIEPGLSSSAQLSSTHIKSKAIWNYCWLPRHHLLHLSFSTDTIALLHKTQDQIINSVSASHHQTRYIYIYSLIIVTAFQ